jgi:hypothetical protein
MHANLRCTTPMLRHTAWCSSSFLLGCGFRINNDSPPHLFDQAQSSAMAVGKRFVSAFRCKRKPEPSQTLSQTDFDASDGPRSPKIKVRW